MCTIKEPTDGDSAATTVRRINLGPKEWLALGTIIAGMIGNFAVGQYQIGLNHDAIVRHDTDIKSHAERILIIEQTRFSNQEKTALREDIATLKTEMGKVNTRGEFIGDRLESIDAQMREAIRSITDLHTKIKGTDQ